MGIIRKLPEMVANKIAAGEVIERPASVVKELVENSIDGESSRVEVELEDGGKRLIRVSDNGTGIAADDLELAVESHATSKLKDSNDLFFITTLGFRGEALPSIGAVAELRIASRVRGADAGAEVEVIGGRRSPVKAAGVPEGTIIEVRNLFFNIPARRKFLKTSSTELSHAVDIITKMALAYPSVSFRLLHNGREVVSVLQNEDRLRRIAGFFGKDLHAGLLEVNSGSGPLTIHGYIAPPSITRANAKLQYVFLNGRFIRDKTVASAVRDAYAGTLPAGKQPIVVLFLQIDPREVDVNVHPTKYEVRFRDSHLIYSGVRRMIAERLGAEVATDVKMVGAGNSSPPAPSPSMERGEEGGPTMVPGTSVERGEEGRTGAPGRSGLSADWGRKIRRDPALFEVNFQLPSAPPAGAARPDAPAVARPGVGRSDMPASPGTAGAGADAASRPSAPPPGPRPGRAPEAAAAPSVPFDPDLMRRPTAFQVHDSYIVEEIPGGIRITDQHALHERILYNQITKRLDSAPLECQRLLIPATVELTSDEVILLTGAAAELRALGFEIEEFGRNTVAVRTMPMMLIDCNPDEFLHEMIASLQEECRGERQPALRESMIKMVACKAAVKANQRLTPAEILSLLQKARQLGGAAATCPHGRPTSIVLSTVELEKLLLRK